MSTYVIVDELGDWPCHADYLLTARTYLQHGVPTTGGRPRIINLCRSLEHLSAGYYCSLLAQARSHRPSCGASCRAGWPAKARTGSGYAPSSVSANRASWRGCPATTTA